MKEQIQTDFDLVIFGSNFMSQLVAYQAMNQGKRVCLVSIHKLDQVMNNNAQYSRRNYFQTTDKSFTKYINDSMVQWQSLQSSLGKKFRTVQGSLSFGHRDIKNQNGNILLHNVVINDINSQQTTPDSKTRSIKKLFIESICDTYPQYFKAFNFDKDQILDYSALDTPDGGSINMKFLYQCLGKQFQNPKRKIKIFQESFLSYYQEEEQGIHCIKLVNSSKKQTKFSTKRIFLAEEGLWTPYYLKTKFKSGQHLFDEATALSLTTSYFQILKEKEGLMAQIPSFYHFVKSCKKQKCYKKETSSSCKQQQPCQYGASGMPYHEWDSPKKNQNNKKYAKIDTDKSKIVDKDDFIQMANKNKVDKLKLDSEEVEQARKFVKQRMNGLNPNNRFEQDNYPYEIVSYDGRFTIMDYLNRTHKDIVVQSGGNIGCYSPLLAKNAVRLMFGTQQEISRDKKNYPFLNAIRFPIRQNVENHLKNYYNSIRNKKERQIMYDTAIVGAGCSGLYSAYRLHANKNKKQKLAIFELSDRISGRLMSFKFKGGVTAVELGGMRYIPQRHFLLNQVIKDIDIPVIDFAMEGDPIQTYGLKAYLRDDTYQQNQWVTRQNSNQILMTAYRIHGDIIGMNATQMLAYSYYLIANIPENKEMMVAYFAIQRQNQPDPQKRDKLWFDKKILVDPKNPKNHIISLDLKEWNQFKPKLLFKYPFFEQKDYQYLPLYKFGCQNVLEMLYSHEAFTFISDQNGYYSNTQNGSYNELITRYLIDFGNVQYKTLAGGYDMMNYNIANVLLDERIGLNKDIFSKKKKEEKERKEKNIKKEEDQKLFEDGGIFILHQLVNIQRLQQKKKPFHKYKLTFQVYDYPDNVETKQNEKYIPKKFKVIDQLTVFANKIILAMPKRSIELLANQIKLLRSPITYDINIYQSRNYGPEHTNIKGVFVGDQFDQTDGERYPIVPKNIYQLIKSTTGDPAIRIMANFHNNWWDPDIKYNKLNNEPNNTGINLINSTKQMRGVSVTDLPIRQTLYFSTPTEFMILGSYNDLLPTRFWSVLQLNFTKVEQNQNIKGGRVEIVDNRINSTHRASKMLEKQLVRQLALMHNVNIDDIKLKECCYQNWEIDPYGGGYHNFSAGYDIQSIMKCIRQPWKDVKDQKGKALDIFVVGEAFSNLAGWVQGAYQTAEHVLQEHYGLSPFNPQQPYIGY